MKFVNLVIHNLTVLRSDEMGPARIDALLVTHFHVDHAASVPYIMERTTFKGRVFMTHPTKAIYKWLLSDYLRVSNIGDEDQLYSEEDLLNSFQRIEAIDYHQQVEVEGIKFIGYNAGHVLGAAMFLIEIAGVKILYTADYSKEEDRYKSEFLDIASFLEGQFGYVELNDDDNKITINMDGITAVVDTMKFDAESDNEAFKKRVTEIMERVKMAIKPVSDIYELAL
ncbi:hypothetical protein INT47_007538 [Mucor saturninus]|uniref:Metallo-beta-lactamase domain-containing protein n=1 Tax=Mucor saturninus TaxID=64648 RepID=A0A8H7R5F8_9FUNG|nr:hypothetical protein INT47_007538 [Mucor saturninus]